MGYLSVLAGAAIFLSGCDNGSNTTLTNTYLTLEELRADESFDAVAFADLLPPSSSDIRITIDADQDRVEGEFLFDPGDFSGFAAQFDSLYQPFEYSIGGYTWVFSCDYANGHCYYWTQ